MAGRYGRYSKGLIGRRVLACGPTLLSSCLAIQLDLAVFDDAILVLVEPLKWGFVMSHAVNQIVTGLKRPHAPDVHHVADPLERMLRANNPTDRPGQVLVMEGPRPTPSFVC